MAHYKDEDQPWHNGSISGHAMGLLSGPKMQAMDDASKPAALSVVEIPTGYTSGPWWTNGKYDGREMGCSIVAASTEAGPLPGNPTRGMVAWASAIMNTDARRCEANARLIAIAPDLAAAYQALQKRIAELEAERGWQPIETGPKDGTEVLVYVAAAHGLSGFISVCAWHPDAGWCADELREVTHWMPLPEPPATPSQDPQHDR